MKNLKKVLTGSLLFGALAGLTVLPADAMEIKTASTYDSFAQETAKLVKENWPENMTDAAAQNPYVLKRLVVKGKGGSFDFSKVKATAVVKGPDHLYVVQFATSAAAKSAQTEIEKWSGVEYVEPDHVESIAETTQESSPKSIQTYESSELKIGTTIVEGEDDYDMLDLVGVDSLASSSLSEASLLDDDALDKIQSNSWGVAKIGAASYASRVKSKTSSTIKVAVVDSGVSSSHSFLKSRMVSGYDYVDLDSNPADQNGHGTHVAGIIVDCTPGLNVKIMPIRVLGADGSGSTLDVSNGIRYAADHGAKVINLSLGGSCSIYKESAISYAVGKGVTVVVSAGNECRNLNNYEYCPAHCDNVICVSALESDNSNPYFTNYGNAIDVSAPGVDIKSCAIGSGYTYKTGTSQAAPHVSAVAAMVKLMHPSYTPAQIETAIKNSCTDLGSKGKDILYGYGIVNCANLEKTVPVTGVTLNKTSVTVTKGNSYTLKATVSPSNATNTKITWSSANPKVATVNSSGKVTTKATGIATITAKTSNGKKATCKVKVVAASNTTLPAPTMGSIRTDEDGWMDIYWKRVSGANGYRIVRYDYATNTSKTEYKSGSNNVNWYGFVDEDTVYRFSITAYKVENHKRVYGKTRSVYLAAPRDMWATNATSTAITLNWYRLKGVSGYRVYTSYSPNSGYSYRMSLDATITGLRITGLDSRDLYVRIIPYKTVNGTKINLPYNTSRIY